MKVALHGGEMATAHLLATLRQTVNESLNIADIRHGAHRAHDLHILGAIAELAWAKHFHTYPDLTCHPRRGTADFTHNGKAIDIKATRNPRGQLITHVGKNPRTADIYVLAIVTDNTVDFIGYATAGELFSPDAITDLGHGPTHVLPQHRLRRFKADG